MNEQELRSKVKKLEKLMMEIIQTEANAIEIKKLQLEIGEAFKKTVFLIEDERKALWRKFKLMNPMPGKKRIRVRSDKADMEDKLVLLVMEIKRTIEGYIISEDTDRAFFDKINQKIREGFYILERRKNYTEKKREKTAERLEMLIRQVANKEEKYYEAFPERKDSRTEFSQEVAEILNKMIYAAEPDFPYEDFKDLIPKHIQGLKKMRFSFIYVLPEIASDDNYYKNTLAVKSLLLGYIKKFIASYKNDITEDDETEILLRRRPIVARYELIWEEYKEKAKSKHEEWVRNRRLDLEKYEKRLIDNIAYRKRQSDILANKHDFIAKYREREENQETFIKKLDGWISDLEEKYKQEDSTEQNEQIAEKIAENKQKKAEAIEQLQVTQEKIKDAQSGIDSFPDRLKGLDLQIKEIEKLISDLKKKLNE